MVPNLSTEVFLNHYGLKYRHLLRKEILIYFSYCSNKNLSEFFLVKLTSKNSVAYSTTDNVILFGDYDLNFFNQREKELFAEFASENGLESVNKNNPTWANGDQETLIDHCLITR